MVPHLAAVVLTILAAAGQVHRGACHGQGVAGMYVNDWDATPHICRIVMSGEVDRERLAGPDIPLAEIVG